MSSNNTIGANLHKIASKMNLPVKTVQQAYEQAYEKLAAQAKIKKFIEIFAVRVTEEYLSNITNGNGGGAYGTA